MVPSGLAYFSRQCRDGRIAACMAQDLPNQPDRIRFALPDVAHTFRRGHRVMVQIQSSWFPLTDRNPQTFTDIPKARPQDFVAATQRIYRSLARASSITLPVEAPVRTP